MLTSTVLVLLMILPGLALFYGGLVRSKNMLSVMMAGLDRRHHRHHRLGVLGLQLRFTDGGSWDLFVGAQGRLFPKT